VIRGKKKIPEKEIVGAKEERNVGKRTEEISYISNREEATSKRGTKRKEKKRN